MDIISLNFSELQQRLALLGQLYDLPPDWLQNKPTLFSNALITIPKEVDHAIKSIIYAIEEVVNLPAYQRAAAHNSNQEQLYNPGTPGVFLSYDFHLSETGPKLIEINSNAGGSTFATLLKLAAISMLDGEEHIKESWEERIIAMFVNEWQLKRGQQPLKRIAIVDDNPLTQHFYPEFLIFKAMFKSHGIDAIIADPAELSLENKQLVHQGKVIDLVYNRLTDFLLQEPAQAHIRQAYEHDYVVLTPHPHTYSMYANKLNLILLSDSELLKSWGVSSDSIEQLQQAIPQTINVSSIPGTELWNARKTLFFKPSSSFGGKGAFRGSKITRGTFEDITHRDYIAQTYVPPSELSLIHDGKEVSFKMDIRYYVYQDQVLNTIARLYQGQTTNFRTSGGGFALLQVSE